MAIQFDSEVLSDLTRSAHLEWLETNGKGGFASSTMVGINTRRYHGLLTAALSPPVRRHVLLSRVEEVIDAEGSSIELGSNFYPGAVHPQGYRFLSSFRLDPFPTFTYGAAERAIEKAVFLVAGEDTVVIRYTLLTGSGCTFTVRPFVAFRDYHTLTHRNDGIDGTVEQSGESASIHPYPGLPALHFHHDASEVDVRGDWWMNQQYPREAERGLDYMEDLFSPFALRFQLSTGSSVFIVASTERTTKPDARLLERAERERRRGVVAAAQKASPVIDERLAAAADAYLAKREGGGSTVIAGYPWFTDWGRDTMISLPGLCLATGRTAEARDILTTFARTLDGGQIPNLFPDSGAKPEYNNVDATLWFVHACGRYFEETGDVEAARKLLLPVLLDIIRHHRDGTRFGIRMDEDGLLRAGDSTTQLTWMDAKVGDWVVTPRAGKPVEVNALWIEALGTTKDMAIRLGSIDDAAARRARAARPRVVRRALLVPRGRLPLRRRRRTRRQRRCFATAEPGVRRGVATPGARGRARPRDARGRRSRAAHALRAAHAVAEGPTLRPPLRGRPARPRRRLSSGNGLALAPRRLRDRLPPRPRPDPGDAHRHPRHGRAAAASPANERRGSAAGDLRR